MSNVTVAIGCSLLLLFVSCSQEVGQEAGREVEVRLTDAEQQEICRVYGYVRKIESDLQAGRIPAGPLPPRDMREASKTALSMHRENLSGLLKKALGERDSSKTREAVLRRCP